MPKETHLEPLSPDSAAEELLEISESVEHALPTRQFCVFRAGRERFCLPVLDIAVTEGRRPGLLPRSVIVAVLAGDERSENTHIGIAADEVIGTYPASSQSLLDHSPPDMPHCRGMFRHDERLALVVDLRQLMHVFSVPVI